MPQLSSALSHSSSDSDSQLAEGPSRTASPSYEAIERRRLSATQTISGFVAAFMRDKDVYLAIEKELSALCDQALRAQNINFLWQSRVKEPESLERKLSGRTKKYKNETDNVADIKDLVAGRIILLRWRDREQTAKIVEQIFNVRGQAQHPKPGGNAVNSDVRFRGYDGLHFHVTWKIPSSPQSYNPVIEIQVMSFFMWGFMELEHDIAYKKLHGEPHENMRFCLELLKGIANQGEIILEAYDREFSQLKSDTDLDLQAIIQTVVAKVGIDENDKQCLRDLRLTDPRHDRVRIEENKDRLLEGLCSWILQDQAFETWWSHNDYHFLWIHGDPGKGKTMLMMALIDEVSKRLKDRPESNLLAYFFCQNTNNELNATVSVLRGLIYLLVDQEKTLIRYVRKKYDTTGRRLFEDENAPYALREILLNILMDQSLGNVYLMVDALDECDPKIHDLLQWIIDESPKMSPRIKWLTTSRNQPDFIERLGRGHQLHTSLELNSFHVARAVASFIDYKVKKLTESKSYSSELQVSVRESLRKKAEDTFLWAALVCKKLSSVRRDRVESWLEKVPPGLTPLYERMLDQVLHQEDDHDVDACRRILHTVVLAFRPLPLDDLAVFAEVTEGVHDLVQRCGSFITIREDSAYWVHQSAKDFLSDENRKDIFPLGQKHEHTKKARFCLELMSRKLKRDICNLKMPGILLSEVDESRIIAHLPFHVQYAGIHWFNHLSKAGSTGLETLVQGEDCQVYVFFKRHFLYWLEALCLMNAWYTASIVIHSLCYRNEVNMPPRRSTYSVC